MSPQRALGNILVRHGAVPPEALEPLYAQQAEKWRGLVELVLESKLMTETELARVLAAECRLPFVERIDSDAVTTDVAMKVPITYAKSHGLLVTAERDDAVEVTCSNPLDTNGLDDIRAMFQKPLSLTVAPNETLIDAINH
ncbi:MAG TPA: type II secretion system protein GspE, partial [Polyangiaceae bacterium]|nr:type II secretion system protein GspE [Polyangiaceae bacterium]